jgi:hypothetical protein
MTDYFFDSKNRANLLAELQSWVGTPFRRPMQGAAPVKHMGGGCTNTLCAALAAVGALPLDEYLPYCEVAFSPADPASLSRQQAVLNKMVDARQAREVPVAVERDKAVVDSHEIAGDLLVFRQPNGIQSVAMSGGEKLCYSMMAQRGFGRWPRSLGSRFGQLIRIVRVIKP